MVISLARLVGRGVRHWAVTGAYTRSVLTLRSYWHCFAQDQVWLYVLLTVNALPIGAKQKSMAGSVWLVNTSCLLSPLSYLSSLESVALSPQLEQKLLLCFNYCQMCGNSTATEFIC